MSLKHSSRLSQEQRIQESKAGAVLYFMAESYSFSRSVIPMTGEGEMTAVWEGGAAATLGHEFENLTQMHRGTTYSFAVLRASHLPLHFGKGIPRVRHHAQACILGIVSPSVVFDLVHTWGTREFEKSKGKHPAAYENDKWATHLGDGSLGLKDASLREESTLLCLEDIIHFLWTEKKKYYFFIFTISYLLHPLTQLRVGGNYARA